MIGHGNDETFDGRGRQGGGRVGEVVSDSKMLES